MQEVHQNIILDRGIKTKQNKNKKTQTRINLALHKGSNQNLLNLNKHCRKRLIAFILS